MNDYLTAIATLELTRGSPGATSTYRPHPRRRKRAVVSRASTLLRAAAPRRTAPAFSALS